MTLIGITTPNRPVLNFGSSIYLDKYVDPLLSGRNVRCPWLVTLSMRQRYIEVRKRRDRQTDGRMDARPLH